MPLDLTTPALLFPAISLLLLAYTSRFLTIAGLIRSLLKRYQKGRNDRLLGQLANLKRRVLLIRNMQVLGVASFFLCVLCMLLLFAGRVAVAQWVFGVSLLLLLASLGLSLWEIQISVGALRIQLSELSDLEDTPSTNGVGRVETPSRRAGEPGAHVESGG